MPSWPGCEASPTRMDASPHCQRIGGETFSTVGSCSWCPESGQERASTAVSSAPHARERAAHNTRGRLKWTGCLCAKQEISRCPKNSPVQSSVVLTCGASREVVPATLRHRGQGCRGMKVQHAQNRKELICPALRDPETETPMNGQAAITPRATGWNREASWETSGVSELSGLT